MLHQVPDLGQRPGRLVVLGGEQTTHVGVEVGEADVHHDERQHEAGHRKPDEPDKGEDVVAYGVLPDGRVDSNWQRHSPGEDDGGHRDYDGQGQAIPDDFHDWTVPLHRHAEVPLKYQTDPPEVLDVHRLVETILGPQCRGVRLRHHA